MTPKTLTLSDPTHPVVLELITTPHSIEWYNCSTSYREAVDAALALGAKLTGYYSRSDIDTGCKGPAGEPTPITAVRDSWNSSAYGVDKDWLPPMWQWSPEMLEVLQNAAGLKISEMPKWAVRAMNELVGEWSATDSGNPSGRARHRKLGYPSFRWKDGSQRNYSTWLDTHEHLEEACGTESWILQILPDWRPAGQIHATIKKETPTMQLNLEMLKNTAEVPFHRWAADNQAQMHEAIRLGAPVQVLLVTGKWGEFKADLTAASAIVRVTNWTPPAPKTLEIDCVRTKPVGPVDKPTFYLEHNGSHVNVKVRVPGIGYDSFVAIFGVSEKNMIVESQIGCLPEKYFEDRSARQN